MILVHFQGKPFKIILIQVYAPTTNAKEAEVEWFCEHLQDLLQHQKKKKKKKKKSFSSKGTVKRYLEYLAWSNRQVCPWSTKWSRAKGNRAWPRVHISHSKHHLPTTQEDSTRGQPQMVNTETRLIIFFAAKDG